MMHTISAFDKTTELMVFEIEIPQKNLPELKVIMAWTEPEDEIFGYDLSSEQLQKLEELLGQKIYDHRYDFQLSSYA
ncbi:hypothetical protein GHO40_17340 [Pseudomonas helleri]|uniref:DUF7683 domain-containing protein n=1 Tax=Pseudomonas helleri TaxID=1608996 RepID=A0A6A7YS90_9PSED|nr:hypothetical protein [Pseudomonas helleri]MQT33827.1 hypothetical protein [Pseudomonas helleri]MQT48470.1 hypothetical protein [Pseudomonas helleri]MQT90442.1 hypothetical protein [Pseudomonas helleri]